MVLDEQKGVKQKKFETFFFHLKFPKFWKHSWKSNLVAFDGTFFIFNQFPPSLTDKEKCEFWFSTKCMPQEISHEKSQQLFSADCLDMWDTSPCESWVMTVVFKVGEVSH